jgi:hypothetical protein
MSNERLRTTALEVKMETYLHLTGSQFNVIFE